MEVAQEFYLSIYLFVYLLIDVMQKSKSVIEALQ